MPGSRGTEAPSLQLCSSGRQLALTQAPGCRMVSGCEAFDDMSEE